MAHVPVDHAHIVHRVGDIVDDEVALIRRLSTALRIKRALIADDIVASGVCSYVCYMGRRFKKVRLRVVHQMCHG